MSGPRRPLLSSRHTRWSYVRTLDKGTAVGVARPVDLQRRYRSPTHVPNSHACGRLSRRWPTALVSETPAVPCSGPGTRVGVMYVRWTKAQPLELHGPSISNAGTDLQRMYPTLTPVGRTCALIRHGQDRVSRPRRPPRLDHCANARTGTAEFVAHDRRRRWSAPPEPTHPVGSETGLPALQEPG